MTHSSVVNFGYDINKSSQFSHNNINIGNGVATATTREKNTVLIGNNVARSLYSLVDSVLIGSGILSSAGYLNNGNSTVTNTVLLRANPTVKTFESSIWIGDAGQHTNVAHASNNAINNIDGSAFLTTSAMFRLYHFSTGDAVTTCDYSLILSTAGNLPTQNANLQRAMCLSTSALTLLTYPEAQIVDSSYNFIVPDAFMQGDSNGFGARGTNYRIGLLSSSVNNFAGGVAGSGIAVTGSFGFDITASYVVSSASNYQFTMASGTGMEFSSTTESALKLSKSTARAAVIATSSGAGSSATTIRPQGSAGANNTVLLPITSGTIALVEPSSRDYKEGIEPLDWPVLDLLVPLEYSYKEEFNYPQGRFVGFLAEDLEASLGEYAETFLEKNPDGKAVGIHYQRFVPILVKELKDVKNELSELRALVNELIENQSNPNS